MRSGRTPSPWVTHPVHRNSMSRFWLTIHGAPSVPAVEGGVRGIHPVTLFQSGIRGQRCSSASPGLSCCPNSTDRNNARHRHLAGQMPGGGARFVCGPWGSVARSPSLSLRIRECRNADHGVPRARLVLPADEFRRVLRRSATPSGRLPNSVLVSASRRWLREWSHSPRPLI